MSRARWRRVDWSWVVLVALGATALLVNLDFPSLFLFDESLYCGATADMAAHDTWLYPTDNGEFFSVYGKPPLINWLQGAATSILGWSLFALRLPSALGMLALVLLTARLGTRLAGREVGLLTAGLMLLSDRIIHTGRHILLEDLVAPLFAAALLLYAAALALEESVADTRRVRSSALLVGSGLCMAAAILGKQAFGLFAPAALLVAELCTRKSGALRRLSIAGSVTVIGSVWWFAASYDALGQRFLDSVLGYHVQARFSEALEGHARGLNAYAASLDDHLRLLPWALAAVGWGALYPKLNSTWQRFLFAAWSALAVLEFLVVGLAIKTFLPWYQLVVMPPLFVGAAHLVLTVLSLSAVPRWVRYSIPLAAVAGAAVAARLDSVLFVGGVVSLALLAAKFRLGERLAPRGRELLLAGLAGVLAIVVANPWHGRDGRYRVAEILAQQGASRARVIGDEWRRVWMCYAPAAERVAWGGSCDALAEQVGRAELVVLDGPAAACAAESRGAGRTELFSGKTKQGGIVLLGR